MALLLVVSANSMAGTRPQIDLRGEWLFYADVGESNLGQVGKKPGKILVPGAWQAQGYGAPGGTIPSANIGPGTSPAEYLRHNLMGRCLYARTVEILESWRSRRVFLCVRRAYRYTDVAVNGIAIGQYEGFSSPFEFDITEAVKFGSENELVLGVDNRPGPGRDTLGTANLLGNWGGLGGRVYLEARPRIRIDDVFVIPKVATSQAVLRVTMRMPGIDVADLALYARITPDRTNATSVLAGEAHAALRGSESNRVDVPVSIPGARLWTPDDPFLYVARVQLVSAGDILDEVEARFGLREITADGSKLFLNGQPLYLTGYGDDATEPITGMLPADRAVYRKRLSLMRTLGFNFVRHHSCVPHDEYLEAADEVGMLVQPEAAMAYTGFWRTGHQLFQQEWPHTIKAFRNHPSVWAWCMGNELFLDQLPERVDRAGGVALSPPLTNGPLRTLAGEHNGVFGPPGTFPTRSFKRSNYYRDVEVAAVGDSWNLLGQAKTTRVFDDGPHELGLRFTSTQDCVVSKIRYYRVAEERGAHVGRVWDSDGRELAQAAFRNESDAGWQEARLAEPLLLHSNRVYTVSVNANAAYCATSGDGDAGPGPGRKEIIDIVRQAYQRAKELDPTRLVHASDGGTVHQFTDVISGGGGRSEGSKPRLLHEYGGYCSSLPDFSLIRRLHGVIRPLTYERAERYVREHRLMEVYPRLYHSSLFMRADAQKYYMESAKAGTSNNGFSFWLGVDFPDSPEGCWDEGILNQLWEPKPHLTENLLDYTGATVLLNEVDLTSRSFYVDEPKKVGLQLWHYGPEEIENARVLWRVVSDGQTLETGESTGLSCSPGERKSAGEVVLQGSSGGTAPRFLSLQVELRQGSRRVAQNAWEFYAYPNPAEKKLALAGVYSEAGPVPGAIELRRDDAVPANARLLVARGLTRARHGELLSKGHIAILLLGNCGFKETKAGYFLNQHGAGFGGIIEQHPMFAGIPHQGRHHLGLYQLVAGGGLLDMESMPPPLRQGAVVWGLQLTGWISPVKNLRKVGHVSEVMTDNNVHLMLCNLDLLADRPECRYVLHKTLEYLVAGKTSQATRRCRMAELEDLIR